MYCQQKHILQNLSKVIKSFSGGNILWGNHHPITSIKRRDFSWETGDENCQLNTLPPMPTSILINNAASPWPDYPGFQRVLKSLPLEARWQVRSFCPGSSSHTQLKHKITTAGLFLKNRYPPTAHPHTVYMHVRAHTPSDLCTLTDDSYLTSDLYVSLIPDWKQLSVYLSEGTAQLTSFTLLFNLLPPNFDLVSTWGLCIHLHGGWNSLSLFEWDEDLFVIHPLLLSRHPSHQNVNKFF